MKNPNGYGSIVKLPGNRRKPYAVKVTDKKASLTPDKNGMYSLKRKYIGYFETLEEATVCLMEYNTKRLQTPQKAINYTNITIQEIWDIWSKRNLDKGSRSRKTAYTLAYKNLEPLHKRKIRELRYHDLQVVFDEKANASKSTLNNMKIVLNFLYDWAMKNDVIVKNYVEFVEIDYKKETNHQPLTEEEVDGLFSSDSPIAKIVLIYCYTGVRPSELLELEPELIHLPDQYFEITASKTKAGERIVPIANKIIPLFKDFVKNTLGHYSYKEYARDFKTLFPNHTPHDTRTTFISHMVEKGIDKTIIQKIVGHKGGDVTTDVYTKLSPKPLIEAVNKL